LLQQVTKCAAGGPPIIAHCWVDENLVNRQLVGKEPVEACVGERATGGTNVSGVVSLQKPRDRAEYRAFQHLLKSTPLSLTTSAILWMSVTISK
jgi:hypothetical protein